MSLTAEQVRWVANLARLELTSAELEAMTSQLNRIVDYIGQLQELNTRRRAAAFAVHRRGIGQRPAAPRRFLCGAGRSGLIAP